MLPSALRLQPVPRVLVQETRESGKIVTIVKKYFASRGTFAEKRNEREAHNEACCNAEI
jgi:hypothetical protein